MNETLRDGGVCFFNIYITLTHTDTDLHVISPGHSCPLSLSFVRFIFPASRVYSQIKHRPNLGEPEGWLIILFIPSFQTLP